MKLINKYSVAALFLSSTMVFTSCEAVQNANNTQKGAVIGTAAGAVLGGILGNNIGKGKNSELGAVLGGVVGGVAGGVIGNKMDKQAKAIKEALEEQYEHRLTVDKRTLIAHILTMKFCKDYHIELLLSEYNNLNFLLSIEDNCKYKIFDVQDEGYFIHKNEGKLTHRECHNLTIKNIINSEGYNDIKEIIKTKQKRKEEKLNNIKKQQVDIIRICLEKLC